MSLDKAVDRESLHKAVARCAVTNDLYDAVAAANRSLIEKINGRPIDARDLGDLATFLRYKPLFDDPKNGKELGEEEFKAECKKLIEAFANDDREKIFEYLDKWYKFVSEYNAPEKIETEADALKYFVYLRSQQGLTVTKMEEYPEYVRSRFRNMNAMMSLQAVQEKIFLETNVATYAFMDNDLEISVASKQAYDKNPEGYLKAFSIGRAMNVSANKSTDEKKLAFAEAFIKATEPEKPAPSDQVSIRKIELPDWVKANKGKDPQTEFSDDDLIMINNCVRMCIGSNGSDYSVIHGYMRNKTIDIDAYRMIFVDGVSIYDSLPEPKKLNDARIKFLDALCNQTVVVSFAHVAEIDGKFEYRVDVLDTRDGNEDKEYSDKIEALENSEDARKALFASEANNLTETLTAGKEATINDANREAKEKACEVLGRKETLLKAEYGLIDASNIKKTRKEQYDEIEVNKKNVGAAFFMLDEVRNHYRRYHKESMKNKAILKARFNSSEKIDERDFVDLMTFTRLAKTLGVGERDLTEAEFAEETDRALTAWSKDDHAAMKPYLDKMYDFVTSYKMPNKIESVDDIMKSMMYLRVQQTVTVKLVENPWYVDMRCPTAMEKARFDAFKAEYYAIYNDVYDGMVKALGSEIGGKEYPQILEQMRKPKQDRSEDDLLDSVEMDLQSFKQSKYNAEVRKYLNEKRGRLANAEKRSEISVYKIDLPDSAKALRGMDITAPEYEDEIIGFETGFTSVIYNLDLNDSKTLREYGYPSDSFNDVSRLIYIDGESLHDIVVREQGEFKSNYAHKKLLHAMINQTGVVQFAHVYKEDDGSLNVETEILDVSMKGLSSLNNPRYITKLAAYEVDKAHYEAVRNKICGDCIESKKVIDEARKQAREQAVAEGNAKYAEEAVSDEADFFNLEDVFDSVEYDVDGNIKERVKKDDGLNKLFKSERGRAMREQIANLAKFAHSDIVVHQLLGKINEVLSQEEINADAYNKLWKDVWLQTIDGLKGVAAGDQYTKTVPFAEATEMVEKFMRGALKLYDHNANEVKPFGGMTEEDMTKSLRAGVPSWEVVHYGRYLGRMNEQQLSAFSNISNIEFRLRMWKKTSMEDYKNMTDVRAFDAYRNMDDTLNAQGKRYATASLIEFYDMINVMARNIGENELYNIDANRLRSDMYKFSANLKKAVLEIGVVDEQGFAKLSGATSPLESEIAKFGNDLKELSEKDKNLEDKKEEVADEDEKNENSLLSEDEILNENDVSIDNIVNENNLSKDNTDNENSLSEDDIVNENVIDTSSNKKEEVIDTSSKQKEEVIDTSSKQKEKVVEHEYRGMREQESEDEISDDGNYRFDNDTTYDNIIKTDGKGFGETESVVSDSSSATEGVVIGDRAVNIAKATRIDFRAFMAGRYVAGKDNPNSAYSVVTNGELRNLAAMFGGITANESRKSQYVKLNETGYDEITPDDVKKSDDFAAKYGIKIYATDIESIIKGFVRENADDLEESVDKTVFEKEYKLLFGDLYMQTLHAANKLYCREGKTITAEQMLGAMHGLDKIMSEAASKAGYPEKIANGGIAPENFKKMQNYFAETFVPKDSSELALRTMQANADGFDFTSSKWKEGLGFTAFTEMVADEKDKLAAGPKNDEAKLKAARKYRAMTNYNGNRSWFSKFWSWRKNGREKRAIEQFKEIAKSTLKIGDREFEELAATQPNADLAALKEGIEKNCAKMETKKNLKGSMISSSAKDDISSSMREDESDRNSVLDSQPDDISLRERITVNEANHQNPRDEKKRKEEDKEKEVKAEKEKENDLNNRAPSA